VQGECGVWPISEEMLLAARQACDRTGALLVFDEIQCGMGRTGTLWAFELTGVRPDVFTVAKSLASGLPIGACVAGGEAAEVLGAGDHGTTFGAGPLVATAALATLDVLDDDALHARVRVLGDRLRAGLERLRGQGRLADVRARGLMIGIDLPPERKGEAPKIVGEALDQRIVLNATGPDTVRFLPPLIIAEEHVDRVLAFMEETL
jgi:acetylornithine/N-succinyldiaminopimelate aminotransferase